MLLIGTGIVHNRKFGVLIMKRFSGILAAFVFSLVSMGALAQDTKIGVVDLQKIMQTAPQMKAIQANLEKEFKPRRDKLVSQEQSLKSEMEKFKRESAVMSQKQRKDMEKKIIGQQRNFEQEGQRYQQELSAAHNKAMESFYKKVRQAIASVAKSSQYHLVLQKDAAPFSTEKLDVTDQVMKAIK